MNWHFRSWDLNEPRMDWDSEDNELFWKLWLFPALCYKPHICCLHANFVYVIIYHVLYLSRDAVLSVPSLALSGHCFCYSTPLSQTGGWSLERCIRASLPPLTINTALPASKQCSTIAEHVHSAYRIYPMLDGCPLEVEQQQCGHHSRSQQWIWIS